MILSHLEINNLRNLESVVLDCAPRFNVIYGENGSGKTSILEAIHLLALGRSFRSHLKSRIINHNADFLSVFAQIQTPEDRLIPAGIQKFVRGETLLRLQGQNVDSIAEFARLLPLQLLNPDSYELLNSGSKQRRQFIDWGVFHVEHRFFALWSKAERILKQRNAALKQQLPQNEVNLWGEEFTALAIELDAFRSRYLETLLPLFNDLLQQLIALPGLEIDYYPGWDVEYGLMEQLNASYGRDYAFGYTHVGPHRADLKLKVENKPVQEILSRGQQKLLVFALRFAQGELLARQQGKSPIYLIDDLASELDPNRRQQVFELIESLSGQFFVTGVESQSLQALASHSDSQMFHVEQGQIY